MSLKDPILIGILNITPDSFSDGGKFFNPEIAINQAFNLINDGASIIDIGGCSTKPGGTKVSIQEECDRVLPVIEELSKDKSLIISIDSFQPEVVEKAILSGAHIINDIMSNNTKMNSLATKYKTPYIINHIQGTPETMQINPNYKNVVDDVFYFFINKINELRNDGVLDIILDPGFGFGKTIEHNYLLMKSLEQFSMLDEPILIGVSRKSMISKLMNESWTELLTIQEILHFKALESGVKILRVHDVKLAKKTLDFWKYYNYNAKD